MRDYPEKDYSYGVVPLRYVNDEWHVLLIQHSKAKYWGFPKGHAELGEPPITAAKRELFEETNLQVVKFLSDTYLEEKYQFTWGDKLIYKTVWYYIAEVSGELNLQEEEVSNGCWVPLSSAFSMLSYRSARSALRKAELLLGLGLT